MLHNFFRPSFLVKSRTVIIPFYNIFFTCCPNWTQACNHIIGYIPGSIGSLFSIAPTQILEWHFCHPFMHLGITDVWMRLALSGGTLTRNVPLTCQPPLTTKPS